ncbi:MAG: four helix bundle protein [Bacteroidaceae bacterium]|nr:four helix bundle protein [Bacteroidaceae bacterium]
MKDNLIAIKSHAFARRMVKAYQDILKKKEYNMSSQALRSGTAVGALVREAEFAQSKADFINKMSIALKEANETDYWLDLLHYGNYLEDDFFESLDIDNKELISILAAIVKKSKENQ